MECSTFELYDSIKLAGALEDHKYEINGEQYNNSIATFGINYSRQKTQS